MICLPMAGLMNLRKITVPITVHTESIVLCWNLCVTTWYKQWHILRNFGGNLQGNNAKLKVLPFLTCNILFKDSVINYWHVSIPSKFWVWDFENLWGSLLEHVTQYFMNSYCANNFKRKVWFLKDAPIARRTCQTEPM